MVCRRLATQADIMLTFRRLRRHCLHYLHIGAVCELRPQALLAHSRDVLAFAIGHDQHRAANPMVTTRVRNTTTREPKRFHRGARQQLDLRYVKRLVSVLVAFLESWRIVLIDPELFRYVVINWSADGILVSKRCFMYLD